MAGDGKEARFAISIDGNAADASKQISASARLAAKSIASYEDEIKSLNADLRRLKGNSDEVNEAKKAIRKRLDEAKSAVATLTVELHKQGTSYASAAKAAQKYGDSLRGGVRGALDKLGAAKKDFGRAWEELLSVSAPARAKIAGSLGPVVRGMSAKAAAVGAPMRAAMAKAMAPAAKKIGESLGAASKKLSTTLAPAGKALGRFGEGVKGVGGKVASVARPLGSGLRKSVGALGSVVKPIAKSSLPALSSALSIAAAGAVTATVAVAAIAAAAVGAAAAVMGLGMAAADSAAKMARQREALLGSAKDAGAMGDQIAALAGKVPQGVEELNALSVSLAKTRLSGKAMVDTMNAVAQATGAVDAAAGAKIQELLTRGQNTGRFALGRRELQGTGIDFDDVAREYAAGTKKSIAAARAELLTGRASLEQGAAAMARATEKKFGKLNLKNAFSLENGPKKFFEQFKLLSSGIDLSPITDGLREAFAQLAPEAPLGRAVKTFMETVGGGLAEVAGKSIPVLLEGFKWLVVGALRVATFFYEMKARIKEAFSAEGWVGVGKEIVVGIIKGIEGQRVWLVETIKALAGSVKDAFTGKLKIQSPSKVFAEYGKYTVEGYAQGVERGSKRASGAVADMVDAPDASSRRTRATGAASIGSVVVNITAPGGGSDGGLNSPEFLASLTRAIRDAVNAQALVPA